LLIHQSFLFFSLFCFLCCAFNNLKLSDLMRPVSNRFYSSSSKRSNNYLFSLCITNKVWNFFFQLFLSSAFFFGWFESPQLCSARTQIYLDCEKTEKTKKLSTFISSLWIPSQKLFAKVEPCDHCQWTRYKSQTKKTFFEKPFLTFDFSE
jgi:hypothetical protein